MGFLIIMGFKKASKQNTPIKGGSKNGKRNTEEIHNEVLPENIKSDNNTDIIINNINNCNDDVVEKPKFKRSNVGIKHNKLVMFGQSSNEKLNLFIDNLKRSNPHIPDYFFNKEVEKFRNKLGD